MSGDGWACGQCTFLNTPDAALCMICTTPKATADTAGDRAVLEANWRETHGEELFNLFVPIPGGDNLIEFVKGNDPASCVIEGKLWIAAGSSDELPMLRKSPEWLHNNGVKNVINTAAEVVYEWEEEGVSVLRVPMQDNGSTDDCDTLSDSVGVVKEFYEAACENGEPVLVHCSVGVSRSASVLLVILMACEGLSLLDALKRVRAVRRVYPNPQLFRTLIEIELSLRGENSIPVEALEMHYSSR